MARNTGPKCKQCRAEGLRLYLKGTRCESSKCPFSGSEGQRRRMPSKPGAKMGGRRRRQTEYGRQLREKQKLKRFYGVFERQFRHYYSQATRLKGNAGVNLLVLFERRLDNALCVAGVAASRAQARQFINHGFVYRQDKRVDIASYQVAQGEEFVLKTDSKGMQEMIKDNLLLAKNREPATWLDTTNVEQGSRFKVISLPVRDQVSASVNEQLIVELCSK